MFTIIGFYILQDISPICFDVVFCQTINSAFLTRNVMLCFVGVLGDYLTFIHNIPTQ